MQHYGEKLHLNHEMQRVAFRGGRVSVGSMVRLGGAAAMVGFASKIKNPEMRWLIISMVGVAASFAEMISRQHGRGERQEAHGRKR